MRREANPLAVRRAVVVEIEPGMIGEDGEAAANEHGDEEEVKEVGVANPEREAVGPGEVAGIDERDGRNVRQAGYGHLNPGRGHQRRDYGGNSDQNRRTNPEAVAAIRGMMNGGVLRVKLDHSVSPLAAWDSAHSARAKPDSFLPSPA